MIKFATSCTKISVTLFISIDWFFSIIFSNPRPSACLFWVHDSIFGCSLTKHLFAATISTAI